MRFQPCKSQSFFGATFQKKSNKLVCVKSCLKFLINHIIEISSFDRLPILKLYTAIWVWGKHEIHYNCSTAIDTI
jgi:hypothetical protein